MRKILNKFLAVFVSFVMAITMIPLSGIVSHAETTVGDPNTVNTYYEKVSKPTTLETGDEVLITYGTKALVANSDGTLTEGEITEGDKLTDVPDGSVWKVNKPNSMGVNKYFFETDKVDSSNRLKVDSNGIAIGNEPSPFTVTLGGKIYREKRGKRNDFSITYDNGFKGQVDEGASKSKAFTFYKKVEVKVKLTINYKYGSKTKTVEKVVTSGSTVDITSDFPGNKDNYSFQNIIYNGTESTSKDIKVLGDAEITVNYKYVGKQTPDDKLYTDDEVNEGQVPEYPAKGSVRINKTATSDDFNGTGVAKVELSTTGVPVKKGVDVVLLFDVSTSMNDDSKLQDAKKSAQDFVDKVLTNSDGTESNNRIALVTFAGYDSNYGEGSGNEVIYPLKNAQAKQQIKNTINSWTESKLYDNGSVREQHTTCPGTDYTYAFKKANEILETSDSSRDKYIVFMTDGAPSKYNNMNTNNNGFVNYVKNNNLEDVETAKQASKTTVYSIGFGMDYEGTNNGFSDTEAANVLKKISSGADDYYIDATESKLLQAAFNKIAASIKKAGTEAVVTDKIGGAFELKTTKTLPNDKDTLSYSPAITVTSYDTWTYAEYSAGNCAYNKIGTRKDNKEVLETVTFSEDGTEAYSNKVDNGKTNILQNGVINAKTFKYTVSTKTFEWTIGDITEQDIALSYYVYLTGSMEGQRGNGVYDTNEKATINYKNYLGQDTTRTFKKPKMPWGSAVVNYEFYLVGEKGQPVNSRGEDVPFAERITIGQLQQKEFNWNNKTELTASIAAKDLVPEGYDLYIDDTVYTANASSKGDGSCTITETVPEGSEGAGKNGSSTNVYQNDEGYTNSYVAFGVKNKTTLIPDSIVIDYGKSIDIDVMKNDRVLNATLDSVAPIGTSLGNTTLGEGFTDRLKVGFTNNISTKQANISVATDKSVVTYTPTKYMDSVDQFYYAAKDETSDGKGGTITSYRYQTVKVIPATTVYYEDNFGDKGNTKTTNGIVYSGSWVEKGETDGTTPEDKQDNKDVSDDGHQYGSDDSYKNDTKLSNGSASVTKGDGSGLATATFTFKGTGFDLIGRTNTSTGLIQYAVYEGTDTTGKRLTLKNLDTVYKDGDLYQIPVINWTAKNYGTYTVKITVASDVIFYLDAIRIYNPVVNDNTANEQYFKDNEANPVIKKVRNLLIKAKDFNEEGITSGAVFVETAHGTSEMTDYINKGPNNEVYLNKGQSVAFSIKSDEKPKSVQIGAKAPNGSAKIIVGSGSEDEDKKISLTSATDMYYDITSSINWTTNNDGSVYGTVIITNNSTTNNENETIIASITNLKLTYANPNKDYDVYVNQNTVDEANKIAVRRMSNILDNSEENKESDEKGDNSQEGNNGSSNEGSDSSEEENNTNTNNPIKDFFNKIFGKWFKF